MSEERSNGHNAVPAEMAAILTKIHDQAVRTNETLDGLRVEIHQTNEKLDALTERVEKVEKSIEKLTDRVDAMALDVQRIGDVQLPRAPSVPFPHSTENRHPFTLAARPAAQTAKRYCDPGSRRPPAAPFGRSLAGC
jgi:hypothetical protein